MGSGLRIRMVVGRTIVTWSPWSEDEPNSAAKKREYRLPFANDDVTADNLVTVRKLRLVSRRG